jgi:hypothetical protein
MSLRGPIRVAILAAALLTTSAITGCASDQTTQTATTSTAGGDALTAQARNPVDLLRKITGCHLDDGVETGERDIDGDRYASCNFLDNQGTNGTDVTVYTGAGQRPDMTNFVTDDSHKVITGPDWFLVITGNWGGDGYSRHVDPAVVAGQVGGTVTAP